MIPQNSPAPVYALAELAEEALALALPTIEALMEEGHTSRKCMHLVVLAPDGEILLERGVGPDAAKPESAAALQAFGIVARSKAAIHHRTGRLSREVHDRAPHLLLVGDTVYGGSAAYEGLIVAGSGVQDYFDEAISAIVAATLWGLIKERQARYRDQRPGQPLYSHSAAEANFQTP